MKQYEFEKTLAVSFGSKPFKDYSSIVKSAILVNQSLRPLIYIGKNASDSNILQEIIAYAEKINAPICSSPFALSATRINHSLYFGIVGKHGKLETNKAVVESDLIIAAGASCSDITAENNNKFLNNKKIICINTNNANFSFNEAANLSLSGNIKEILSMLISITLSGYNYNNRWLYDLKA